MAINLWKAGGKPTSYSPLPTGTNNYINIPLYKDYILIIKAKSASNAILKVSSFGNVNDLYTDTTLTGDFKTYTFSWRESEQGALWIIDKNNIGDIIIDSIELVQKPLSKLTLNGIDGFKSGKWTLHANASALDDETLVLNATGDFQGSTLAVPCLPNTDYTFKAEGLSSAFYVSIAGTGFTTIYPNSTNAVSFKTGATTTSLNFQIYNGAGARGQFTFKRPMLNLGATPAPYSKKTGDKMVMPVALRNMLGVSDVKRADCQTIHANVTDVQGISGFQNGLRFPNNSATIYAYQSNVLLDKTKTYTFSCYAKMDDNSAPVLTGAVATVDISIVIGGNAISTNTYVESIGNGVYRISANILNTNMLNTNIGVVKYSNNSPKGFTISGWQLEEGTTPTPFKPYAVQVNAKPKRYVPKKNLFNSFGSTWKLCTGSGSAGFGKPLKDYVSVVSNARTTSDHIIPVKPNTTYRIDLSNTNVDYAYATGDFLVNTINDLGWMNRATTFTTGNNVYYIAFVFRFLSGNLVMTDPNVVRDTCNIMLTEGTEAVAYEPYQLILPRAKTGLSYEGQYSYLQLPSMTMDSIEIDCLVDSVQPSGVNYYLFDARTSGVTSDNYVISSSNGSNINSLKVDSVTYPSFSSVPRNQRIKTKTTFNSPITQVVNIFSRYNGVDKTKGTLYKVTCYLAGSIVAQYDFENPNNIVGDKVLSIADYYGPGKNKFDKNAVSSGGNASTYAPLETGVRVTATSTGTHRYVKWDIDVKPNTSYTIFSKAKLISGDLTADGRRIRVMDTTLSVDLGTARVISETGDAIAFNTGSNSKVSVLFYSIYAISGIATVDFTEVQVEEGSVATTYEPYQLITIKRDTKNLIPSFEDARWSIHPNAQVLGKDYLRLNATGTYQMSSIVIPVIPNGKYLFAFGKSDSNRLWARRDSTTGLGLFSTNNSIVTLPSDVNVLYVTADNGTTTGTFDFIKPSLYLLDSKEGTIVGSPIKLNKPSKRTLYAKR